MADEHPPEEPVSIEDMLEVAERGRRSRSTIRGLAIVTIVVTLAFVLSGISVLMLRNEIHDRTTGECHTLQRAVEPIRKIVLFATQPANLSGLTGDRFAIGQATNAQRAKTRKELLPLIPTVTCTN